MERISPASISGAADHRELVWVEPRRGPRTLKEVGAAWGSQRSEFARLGPALNKFRKAVEEEKIEIPGLE